jgi:hypothetical protein
LADFFLLSLLLPLQDLRSSETDSKSTAEAMANSAGLDAEKDSAADLAAAGYGTRSRHRSGTSRPNYAEDKDIEMDVYDYYDKKDADGAKKSSRFNATSNDSAPRGSAATRKAATADDSKAAPSQNGARDHISNGTTNAQASQISAAQPSRKRKAAVAAAQMTSVAASNKRAGTSTPQSSVTTWPETNMLSFENCKARPQNGRMVADDGTVLEANGNDAQFPQINPRLHHTLKACAMPISEPMLTTERLYRSCVPSMRAPR